MDIERELIPVRIKQHEAEIEKEEQELPGETNRETAREIPRRWYVY